MLKAILESLEGLEEPIAALYEEKDGAFVLQVQGIDGHPSVKGLRSAFEKGKRDLKDATDALEAFGGITPDEIEELRTKAENPGESTVDADALVQDAVAKTKAKSQRELDLAKTERDRLYGALERVYVENELNAAIAKHGVKDEYRSAVRSLLKERAPQMIEDAGDFRGVFKADIDGIPGDHAIDDYVGAWVKTDGAKAFLPPSGKAGSGAPPTENGRPAAGPGQARIENGMISIDPDKVLSGDVEIVQ